MLGLVLPPYMLVTGGFKRMTCMDQEGNLVPAIRNREGLLVPDIRTTDFIVPEGGLLTVWLTVFPSVSRPQLMRLASLKDYIFACA